MIAFILAMLTTGIIFSVYLLFKIHNAYDNQMIILNAINDYSDQSGNIQKSLTLLKNIEPFTKTVFRLWDWGYENILPKEDFGLIKPYIQEKRKWRSKKI